MTEKLLYSSITEKILGSYYSITKVITYGLPIDIYRNALMIELEYNKLQVERDYEIGINYRDKKVGTLQVDFLVEKKVIVQLVAEVEITTETLDWIKRVLRNSPYEICLVLNPNGDGGYKRIIFTNDFKQKIKREKNGK